MIKLDLNQPEGSSGIISRVAAIYYRITSGDNDYQRNESSLEQIQFCVITVSAIATGGVNAFAHQERLGWIGASLLAILIMGFVEKFYFTLRHGLMTVYRSRKQRCAARLSYRVIQLTMILNATILCTWITGMEMPNFLSLYNRYSIAVHFALALVGVAAVRDYDSTAETRIRELKAEASEYDLLIIRKAAANNHLLLLFAARLRGWLDGISLAFQMLRDKENKSLLSANYLCCELTDDGQCFLLPGRVENNPRPDKVTDVAGKRSRR
jgi:hypothetical protein